MTGSRETGLVIAMEEEALRAGIPVLAIDVKGALPNLLLAFPSFAPEAIQPWASAMKLAFARGLRHDVRRGTLKRLRADSTRSVIRTA
jgi:hypothetical protein